MKETPDKKRSHRLMTEVRQEPGLKIGIIGIGRLGHLLATNLIRYGDVYPQELFLVRISLSCILDKSSFHF